MIDSRFQLLMEVEMSRRTRKLVALCAVAVAVTLVNVGEAQASGCGFAGVVLAGDGGGTPTGYVILFLVAFPFDWMAVGAVPIGNPVGDACMDIWRDATIGPAPANFVSVVAAGPVGCATNACSGTPVVCSPVTLCMAFP
jgi:hypothetical protein